LSYGLAGRRRSRCGSTRRCGTAAAAFESVCAAAAKLLVRPRYDDDAAGDDDGVDDAADPAAAGDVDDDAMADDVSSGSLDLPTEAGVDARVVAAFDAEDAAVAAADGATAGGDGTTGRRRQTVAVLAAPRRRSDLRRSRFRRLYRRQLDGTAIGRHVSAQCGHLACIHKTTVQSVDEFRLAGNPRL
jgi:hypothetical protein